MFEYLRPGDIVTHIFHGAENNVLDGQGQVRSEAREAKSRGILLDIGAAKINFSIELSRAAIAQGMLPDTLSSDITKDSPGDACLQPAGRDEPLHVPGNEPGGRHPRLDGDLGESHWP